MSAVKYCHSYSIAHRDLKLDNTLLDSSNPPKIKICDFGFAKDWSEDNLLTQIGTPVYMSPELIKVNNKPGEEKKGYSGASVDVWASGILLLVMLLGSFPFDHHDHPDPNTSEAHLEVWLQQVSKRWSEVPHMRESINNLSIECKDLLNRIFVIDAEKRIKIEQIERHPWYKKPLPAKYEKALEELREKQKELDKVQERRMSNKVAEQERRRQLQALVMEATMLPNPDEDSVVKRMDLSDSELFEQGKAISSILLDDGEKLEVEGA